ncbi:hypothetical protein SAMN06298212_10761 [Ruaniaceae bacterium KH17]|nr:hypothetical protein SAMN06298212_10761 [Ruaniaceae bacterium KH17]
MYTPCQHGLPPARCKHHSSHSASLLTVNKLHLARNDLCHATSNLLIPGSIDLALITITIRLMSCHRSLAHFGERNDILNSQTTMTTLREAAVRKHAVFTQPVNELASDAKQFGCLCWRHLVLDPHHHDSRTLSKVIKN